MNMKSTLFAGLLAASLSVPAFASDTHTATPLPQFSAADTQMLFAQDTMPMQLAVLSQQEMMETEGAIAPLVALGIIHGGRFVAQRWVAQRVAAQTLARGNFSNRTFGAWSQTTQQARAISTQAWGRSNVITHRAPQWQHANYSHFQHASQNVRGHSYYGSRFR